MSTINGDIKFTDEVVLGGTAILPSSCVSNSNVSAAAAILSSKLKHTHMGNYAKVGSAASESAPLHIARAAGDVLSVEAFLIGACTGDATVTVNILKNGTTILSAAISFDSGDAARAVLAGTITDAPYSDGDVFEAVIVATPGTGAVGTGLGVEVSFDEGAE